MFIIPSKGLLSPKNANDQVILRANCIPKAVSASLFFLYPFIQTRYSDKPIKKYNVIHTGANNHEGGVKNGFSSIAYHVPTDSDVAIDPIMPAN